MEKQDILTRQAMAVRLEAVEKALIRLEESQTGLIKRFKQIVPKSSNIKLIVASVVSLASGIGIGLFL